MNWKRKMVQKYDEMKKRKRKGKIDLHGLHPSHG